MHQPLDGLHHALRVVHEHRKRADEHDAAHREDTALPQDDRQSRRGRERRCGHEKAPEMHLPHALALHFSRKSPKLLLHFFFDHKRLRRLRARDALVEAGGDLRVLFAHAPVVEHKLLLEIDARNREHRYDRHHAQRKLPVERKHHHNRQRQIRNVPDRLHEAPRQNRRDLVRVGHHARVDIADAVLIEVGKGQRLQMVKANSLEVAPDVHFRLARGKGRNAVRRRLDDHDKNVEREKAAEARERFVCNKVVDRVLLKKRDHRVHRASDKAQRHHVDQHQPPIALEIRKELRNAEPARLFVFHAGSSSPTAICT